MLRTNLSVEVTAVGSQDLSGARGTVPAARPPSLHTASPSPQEAGHLTGSESLGPSQYPELEPCLTLGGGIP